MKIEDWRALDDGEFQRRWRALTSEEHAELTQLERTECSDRYRKLNPWLVSPSIFKGLERDEKRILGTPPGATDDDEDDSPPDWSLHQRLCRNFIQIYPSDEAYDCEIKRIVKIQHLRLRHGNKAVRIWLRSPKKRLVLAENVVFEPGVEVDPETHINLYQGLAIEPSDKGKCDLQLELLHYLCAEDDRVFEFCDKWCALPLQRLGSKMHTALVFHGEPGAGKNLFFSALSKIYGEAHSSTITNMQLESQFNEWASAKQFILANEVVARRELRHQAGYLLNLVTEPEIWINPKQISGRMERNHMNIVFFSNELEPLHISPLDRRYMVIRTPKARPQSFYDAVVAEQKNGGIAALLKHFLELELGDFGVQTKPIETQAKRDLIEIGLPTSQLLWRDIKEGALGVPYVPCLVTDLYRLYNVYCRRIGEKMPERINRFVPSFMRMNGVRRVEARVPDPETPLELANDPRVMTKRRVLIMGEPDPDPAAEHARIIRGTIEFRKASNRYIDDDSAASSASWGSGQDAYRTRK